MLVVKKPPNSTGDVRDVRCGFDSWVRKSPWGREWQPTPVFLSGESHGQRSLWATVHRAVKSWTLLKRLSTRACIGCLYPGLFFFHTGCFANQHVGSVFVKKNYAQLLSGLTPSTYHCDSLSPSELCWTRTGTEDETTLRVIVTWSL